MYCRIHTPEKAIPYLLSRSLAFDEENNKKVSLAFTIAHNCNQLYPEITNAEGSIAQSLIRYCASKAPKEKAQHWLGEYTEKPITHPAVHVALALKSFEAIDYAIEQSHAPLPMDYQA